MTAEELQAMLQAAYGGQVNPANMGLDYGPKINALDPAINAVLEENKAQLASYELADPDYAEFINQVMMELNY